MVGGESLDPGRRAIDGDSRPHFEGVPLGAALKLLIPIMRQPYRTVRQEHRCKRHIQHKRRVVLAAEAASEMGEVRVDAARPEWRRGLAEQESDRFRRPVWRLHAEHKFE